MTSLGDLLARWRSWAGTADKGDDGWEAIFPDWGALIDATLDVMRSSSPDNLDVIKTVDAVWQLDHEDEILLDTVADDRTSFQNWTIALARSESAIVRWQIYEVLGRWGIELDRLREAAKSDPDSYARRRAVFAIARTRIWEAAPFAEDPEEYIRLGVLRSLSEWFVRYLKKCATEESPWVRDAAVKTLGQLAEINSEIQKHGRK